MTLMCACADKDANWRGHCLNASYVCTCQGRTVSRLGLHWAPLTPPPPEGYVDRLYIVSRDPHA